MKEEKNPKVLPNNFEAEQSLLGAIMIDPDVGLNVLAELKSEDFYYTAHRLLFNAMYELQSIGKPIDLITIGNKLTKEDKLDKVGGMAYLAELTNILPSSANYRYYFDIVRHDGMLRRIIDTSKDIIENAYASEDSQLALSYAEKRIFDLSDSVENKDLQHVRQSAMEVLDKIEKILTDKDAGKGLLTHFHNLDSVTNGYLPGQMIVLAARPGVGKTSFAMNIVGNIARRNPEKVMAIFNLEMSTVELSQRLMLIMSGVPMSSVMAGANVDECKRLWAASNVLANSNVYIDDTTGSTPEQIMSKCRRLKQTQKRLDLVVIDYLQLLRAHTQRSSLQQEVSEISRSIKIMAKELRVPIIILSQTSRDLEKRPDKTPKLSDLRDSGAIEQDADQVYFLVKDDKQVNDELEIVDLVICKHRSGECKTLKYKWEGSMVKFTPISVAEANIIKHKQADGMGDESAADVPKPTAKVDRTDIPDEEIPEGVCVQSEGAFIDSSVYDGENGEELSDDGLKSVAEVIPDSTLAQSENVDWRNEFEEARGIMPKDTQTE